MHQKIAISKCHVSALLRSSAAYAASKLLNIGKDTNDDQGAIAIASALPGGTNDDQGAIAIASALPGGNVEQLCRKISGNQWKSPHRQGSRIEVT